MYLLFAYNDNDPTGDDIPQHQYRQSMIINLFGNIVEPPPPADLSTLDILNENVCIIVLKAFCSACLSFCQPS